MIATVHLKETSQEIAYGMAENTYVKGPFYCVFIRDTEGNCYVHKYPLADIWRVTEDYGTKTLEHG